MNMGRGVTSMTTAQGGDPGSRIVVSMLQIACMLCLVQLVILTFVLFPGHQDRHV